jgi:hypothetical protein
MQAGYEKIRQDRLDQLKEPAKSIVASQFSATPRLEAQYYDYVSRDPYYRDLHARWILSISPLPPLPGEEELYRLREDVLGIRGIAEPKTVVLSEPLFALLLDICIPFFEPLVGQALAYYSLPQKTDADVETAVQRAAYRALIMCDAGHVQEQRYPDFITAFGDTFKLLFAVEIGFEHEALPVEDAPFVQTIEKEWQRLLPRSDYLYGFEVVPELTPEAMLRYLRLPFENEDYRHLLKQRTYQQINNYIVALATFKPVPYSEVTVHFRQELCALYLPLAESIAKRKAKKKEQIFSAEDILAIVREEIPKATAAFDYFYATKKSLGQGKQPAGSMVFPLNNSYLAKIGHLSSNDEFPFTAYLEQKLEERMSFYFADDLARSGISLDKESSDKDDEGGTLLDTIADGPGVLDNRLHIPDYDAIDKEGKNIGWRRDTFAGIIGKHRDTLKRWDQDGSLVPKRYSIYSFTHKKNIEYRAYTREDREKVKEVETLKAKKARHQD